MVRSYRWPVSEPERSPEDVEVIREAMTAALYISLSLLAVIVALPAAVTKDSETPALTIALTALALVLAHQIAFRVSTRLVSQGLLDAQASKLVLAQLSGGLLVTAVAVLPVLVLGSDGLNWSIGLMIAFVAAAAYLAARSVPRSVLRSLGYAVVVILGAGVVLVIKSLIAH